MTYCTLEEAWGTNFEKKKKKKQQHKKKKEETEHFENITNDNNANNTIPEKIETQPRIISMILVEVRIHYRNIMATMKELIFKINILSTILI